MQNSSQQELDVTPLSSAASLSDAAASGSAGTQQESDAPGTAAPSSDVALSHLAAPQHILRQVFYVAWPIMVSYVAIGLPSGLLEAQCGLAPWMAFALSATFYSGAGQFMMSNLWITGVPLASIIASVAAVSTRQALYSASLAPYLENKEYKRSTVLATLVTVTDETYGVSLSKFEQDGGWTATHSLLLNLMCMLSWSAANAVGVVISDAIDVPTAIASFAMTSLFICLWITQPVSFPNIVAALTAIAAVVVLKFTGLSNIAVPAGAVVGVACAYLANTPRRRREAAGAVGGGGGAPGDEGLDAESMAGTEPATDADPAGEGAPHP